MSHISLLTFIIAAAITVECTRLNYHHKREASTHICDPVHNNTNKVQCFCTKDHKSHHIVRTADCYLTEKNVIESDSNWIAFENLRTAHKVVLTNTRGISLQYIPTRAIKELHAAKTINIKFADIKTIQAFAFGNLSNVEEITLSDNQIEVLHKHAFAHHKELNTINLDTNNIVEINRDIFHDLPSLEKLFLTSNKITTIHDRAFMHLPHLKELELDKNYIFSLNSETFYGLKSLQRLELSNNSLEVIGDGTFKSLSSLVYLNLDGNKIQMLDDHAFNGLVKLNILSLAMNKMTSIDSVRVFENLDNLNYLSIRGNQLQELKSDVMAPILKNFYGATSKLDFEDNNFPCDCRLDWFIAMKNKTQNEAFKISIENLKCQPSEELHEEWKKFIESEKSSGPNFDDVDGSSNQNGDFEYYDDTQLEGKLFYIDIRDLLNCSKTELINKHIPSTKFTTPDSTPKTVQPPKRIETMSAETTKVEVSTTKVISSHTTEKINLPETTAKQVNQYTSTKVINRGVLDLTDDETSPNTNEITTQKVGNNPDIQNLEDHNDKNLVTTTRLATVSAKPVENKMYEEREMASDEAVANKIEAHRREQKDVTMESPKKYQANSAKKDLGSIFLITAIIISVRLSI